MRKQFAGKVVLIRRGYVVALGLCALVFAIFYIINHPALVGEAGRERVLPIYSVQRDERVLSLTFNLTEPVDQHSARVIESLNAWDVRASFFVTGDWLRANEELAVTLLRGGHELMNLSDDHSVLRRQTAAAIQANLAACNDALRAIAGVVPTLFRPPYGEYDDRVIAAAAAMGMRTIQWSIDSGDWRGYQAQAITRRVTGRAFPGGIVLLHGNLEQTALALPDILERLTRDGYVLIPVSEMVFESEYSISPTGRQIPVSGS